MYAKLTLIASLLFVNLGLRANCKETKEGIVAELSQSKIHLCSRGVSESSFRISIGKAGIGKTTQGDNKTPVGIYNLGKPRPSQDFHIFIPIGYPTPDQIRQGYTGSAIGLHGPKQGFWLPSWLFTLVDWTQGCIAVGSNREIESIAQWLQSQQPSPSVIAIEP